MLSECADREGPPRSKSPFLMMLSMFSPCLLISNRESTHKESPRGASWREAGRVLSRIPRSPTALGQLQLKSRRLGTTPPAHSITTTKNLHLFWPHFLHLETTLLPAPHRLRSGKSLKSKCTIGEALSRPRRACGIGQVPAVPEPHTEGVGALAGLPQL